MPYSIHKVNNGYVVKSPRHAWKHDSLAKAQAQVRLLNAIEHNKNFKPRKKRK